MQVSDVFMYPAQRLQLYLCQQNPNDSNNTQNLTNPPSQGTEGWWLLFSGLPVCREILCLFIFLSYLQWP